mmetsp:Transcript_33044/g.77274  ORF Transcript_33044/g.77274 Transcript_33044/m.77274 type:complete len:232 (+) Transcript_33044:112-807(+)
MRLHSLLYTKCSGSHAVNNCTLSEEGLLPSQHLAAAKSRSGLRHGLAASFWSADTVLVRRQEGRWVLQEFDVRSSLLDESAPSSNAGGSSVSDFLGSARSQAVRPRVSSTLVQAASAFTVKEGELEASREGADQALDDAMLLRQRVARIRRLSKRSAKIAYIAFSASLAMAFVTLVNSVVDFNNAKKNLAEVEDAEGWLDESGWPAYLERIDDGQGSEEERRTRAQASVTA